MITRDDIVKEAREWLGTRWMHQQSLKGIGCDCIGLVRGVGMRCGLLPSDLERQSIIDEFRGYGRIPDGRIVRGMETFLIRTDNPQPGDVLLMSFEKEPQHVGIVTDVGIIHAAALMRKVVEHRIDETWQRRIVRAYSWPGVKHG